ncbi:hypothetical protein GF385_03700 [Candidatus Dependentiae bacterium]|nr:hypothetical protein [Candidatus Dependentiae bacterium]
MKQKKNHMLAKFYTLRDFKRVKKIAQKEFGLKELRLSQIKTLKTNLIKG